MVISGRSVSEPDGIDEGSSLVWTDAGRRYPRNTVLGNRWLRNVPFCSDGTYLYFLVPFRETNLHSPVVRLVVEVYELDDQDVIR